ncbi:MAG: hypothetical protein ACRDOK_08615 [Streptosporangiaceae bacterium]
MAGRPFHDAPGRVAAVYWRRRSAALVASLSVLIGVSWTVARAVGSLDRPDGRPARSAVASTRSGPVGAAAGLTGTTQLGVPDATSARRAAPAALPSCPVAAVALTLAASQPSYSAQQLPAFDVGVVSRAGYSCTFDIGARHLLLQISAGATQVWTSADCAEGLAVQLATLPRGAPARVHLTWDDQYSTAGCPVPGRIAPAGSYTARATVGSAASNSVTFRIG